ncbi:MAG TPA: ABC transporter permease [Ignavibacteriaceae bacterium]|nr:ABC transporter permease [Ignavibacteriaceae bacterium]
MFFPFLIAKRDIFSRKDSRLINLISSLAITGIALACATLIIALNILNGFEQTLTNKIIDFDSHIQITSYRGTLQEYEVMLSYLESRLKKDAESISPFASKLAIISNKNYKEGVNIKGITPGSNTQLKKDIISGGFNLNEEGNIVIGKKLADKLFIKVGDKITLFALKNDQLPSMENFPNIKKYVVKGIFESGMSEYDDLFAYVNLQSAQDLFSLGNTITGYDIKLKNPSKIDSITNYLSSTLRYPHYVRSIYETHRNIFTWISLQKELIPISLNILNIIAVTNIISTLLMLVLEKTNVIGILKSLGARNRQILGIFLVQGAFISFVGIVLGNILALILSWLQYEFKIISLPSQIYFMSSVPMQINWMNFADISLKTFLLSLVVALLPSYIAAKTKPVSTLRFS